MIIIFIFCVLGVGGYFNDILWLTYLGMGLGIFDHIFGVFIGVQKSLNTLWIAILVGIGMAMAGNGLLESLAICICFENVISVTLGLVLMIVSGINNTRKIKKAKKISK